jgi:hypothetical protein
MLSSAPAAPVTDFNETLNRFKDELSRSIESSLGYKSSLIGPLIASRTLRIFIS